MQIFEIQICKIGRETSYYIYIYTCLRERHRTPFPSFQESLIERHFWEAFHTIKIGVSWPVKMRSNMSKMHFFFLSLFFRGFQKIAFFATLPCDVSKTL